MDFFVSVIIPVYNMERYLEDCVLSVLSQNYENVEIILVNDGSKDNSLDICNTLASKRENIRVIDQENSGVSVARNTGIAAAQGKYLLFLDADDKLATPDAIRALTQAAEENHADLAIGRYTQKEEIPIGVFTGEEFLIKALEDHPITYFVWRILFRREFVANISFEKGFICGEDSYFNFCCALKNPRVVTVNDVVYSYTVNRNSATRSSFTQKRYEDICALLLKKEVVIKESYPHLLPLLYHLKTKIQMMLLTNLMYAKGKYFRQKEKETLCRFKEAKSYFQPSLPYSNSSYYAILSRNLYYPYKLWCKLLRFAKRLIKR